ncbi:MAG: hypothetical protein ACOCRK_09535 [bacterium]
MKLQTKELNNCLNKIKKLVGSNSNIELCDYIELNLVGEELYITSTDMTNYITASMEVKEGEDNFKQVVEGQKLINLVKSIDEDIVELIDKEDYVLLKSNGKYKLDCLKQEYPDYEITPDTIVDINKSDLLTILDRHNGIIAEDMAVPELTGYKISTENVITLDGIQMAITDINIFEDTDLEEDIELLVPDNLLQLVTLFKDFDNDNIKLHMTEDSLLFENGNLSIFGGVLHGIEDFPELGMYFDLDFDNKITVKRKRVARLLDRMSLFVTEEQKYAVNIISDNRGLVLQDEDEKAKEKLTKLKVQSEGQFKCYVDINNIINFVDNLDTEKVTLMYDDGDVIKVTSDKVNTDYFSTILVEDEVEGEEE